MKVFMVKHPILTLFALVGICKTVSDTIITVTKIVKTASDGSKTINIEIRDVDDSDEGEKNKEN